MILLSNEQFFIFFSTEKKKKTFIFFQTAMEVMQFSKEEVREVLRLTGSGLYFHKQINELESLIFTSVKL